MDKYLSSTLVRVRDILEGGCVILNDKVGCFKFSVIDNEFHLFLRFGGFNVLVYNVGYYFIVFMQLILVV